MLELAKRLTGHFEVTVLAPHAPGASLQESMEGVSVHRFRYCVSCCEVLAYNGGIMGNLAKNRWRFLLVPLFLFSEGYSLVRLTRKLRPDVIHAHWLIPQGMVAVCAGMLCRGRRPALVCTAHGSDLLGLPGGLFAWLKAWTIARLGRLAVVSEALRARAAELAPQHSAEVLPMGVDLSARFTPPAASARTHHEILCVGRLVEGKGVRHLIAAMPQVLMRHPDARLTIAGDGPDRQQLEACAETLGLAGKVAFPGALENEALPSLYGRAAVFVLPSLGEGLGLTAIEALGCECPVVASDLAAVREVVIDGVTGLLCRPGDPGGLAAKIIWLLDHPEQRAAMAHAGRQHVAEKYGWETVARNYRQLFDAMIS